MQDTLIHGQTVISPIALAILILSCCLIFFSSKRIAFSVILLTGILISAQQRIVIFGADFTVLRIIVLFGLLRVVIKKELLNTPFSIVDKLFICFCLSRIITYTILWGTFGAFLNRVGNTLDIAGVYFLFRALVIDLRSIDIVIRIFGSICIVLAISMFIEWSTQRNLFSAFGGVPPVTMIRDGRLRCQGPFQHPITAGTFGASLVPIFIAQLLRKNSRIFFFISILSSFIITFTSSSSGPALTFLAALFSSIMWQLRHYVYLIRRAAIILLILLHIVMEAPVWSLVMRVKVFGGSTGYHRYVLLDEFIRRTPEWFLFGVHSTANWGHYGMNLWDVTNHYIRIAVDGGFISLFFFLLILYFTFKHVGLIIKKSTISINIKYLSWGLGAMLFSHCVSFFGVSYFDQVLLNFIIVISLTSQLNDYFSKQDKLDQNGIQKNES